MKTSSTILLCVLLLAFLSACASAPAPTPTPFPTATPPPTATASATPTATATATATNTPTPLPTATATRTETPKPTATATLTPSPTPELAKLLDPNNWPMELQDKFNKGQAGLVERATLANGRFWWPKVAEVILPEEKVTLFWYFQSEVVFTYNRENGTVVLNGIQIPYSARAISIASCGPVYRLIPPSEIEKIPSTGPKTGLDVYVYSSGKDAGKIAAVIRPATDDYCRQ